jgi:hypothetical protein
VWTRENHASGRAAASHKCSEIAASASARSAAESVRRDDPPNLVTLSALTVRRFAGKVTPNFGRASKDDKPNGLGTTLNT